MIGHPADKRDVLDGRSRLCATPRAWLFFALTSAGVVHAQDTPSHSDTKAATAPQSAGRDTSTHVKLLAKVVVEATAVPGGATLDADKVPGNVQSLSSADLARNGSANMTQALNAQLGSISINDNLNDPYQPDILYRGFEASPVLGTPQGLAVYQNGVRINEAFGDTVNWDLFPDMAIDRVQLVSSNPVYGLNALGGAISVDMKNGFNYAGGELELGGGSFGQRSAGAQYGANNGTFGIYAAAKTLNSDGWRDFSSDALRQFYTDLSLRTDALSLDLSYTHAENHLDGQGSAPAQELAVSRRLVFTGPQANDNELNFATLNGTYKVTDHWSVQGVLYYRQFTQHVSNGNTTDYTACTDAALAGSLCQSDGATPVTNAAGQNLPDISQGGAVPIGENDFETINSYSHGATLQIGNDQSIVGHDNQFTAGATFDYAHTNFYSGAQIGVIDAQLTVLPSNLYADTPESSPFGAVPVILAANNRDIGGYVTDTFNVTPDVALTASGRYDVAHIDLQDQRGTSLDGNNRFSHFNPAIGGTYKISPTLTAYAGIATSTRTPTASEIECSDPLKPCLLPSNLAGDPPNLRQVVAHTAEFGLRGHDPDALSGAISWNVGAFRTNSFDDIYGIATSVSSGFYQNIGSTRREGVEAGFNYNSDRWSTYVSYSYVDATFRSALQLPSPSNPFQDDDGNIEVRPGDRLPGIPKNRLKAGVDYAVTPQWKLGASIIIVSNEYYFGDESNQNKPLPGYHVVNLHASYRVAKNVELFGSIDNVFNAKYATYGIYSDPTGVGAPGVPVDGVSNGPGVDNRFFSPAAPTAFYGGVRVTF
jgi:iron complex outermembrane receptor protein